MVTHRLPPSSIVPGSRTPARDGYVGIDAASRYFCTVRNSTCVGRSNCAPVAYRNLRKSQDELTRHRLRSTPVYRTGSRPSRTLPVEEAASEQLIFHQAERRVCG